MVVTTNSRIGVYATLCVAAGLCVGRYWYGWGLFWTILAIIFSAYGIVKRKTGD